MKKTDQQDETFEYKSNIQSLSNLLLAYLYHLNNACTKYIAMGYSSKTLEPTIVFHNIGQSVVELDCLEYTNIILMAEKIQAYFAQEPMEEPVTNRYIDIKLQQLNGEKYVLLQSVENKDSSRQIMLNTEEWLRVYELIPFFNPLIMWYKTSTCNIKQYYDHYLKLCRDSDRVYLGPQDFFSPNEIPNGPLYISPQQPTYNYSRLFHEIGVLCRNNIFDMYLNNLYSTIINDNNK